MIKKLLTSAAVIGLALAAPPAYAFDEIVWDWDNYVDSTETIVIDVNADIEPTGSVTIEDHQVFNGDVTSRVEFYADNLDGTSGELPETITVETETPIEGSFSISGTWDANAEGPNVNDDAEFESDIENFEGTVELDDESEISVQPSEYSLSGNVDGVVMGEQEVDLSEYIEDSDPVDAAENMASVVGESTAIANYKSIQTETATFLDESQVHNALNEGSYGTDGYGVEATAVAGTYDEPIEAGVDLTSTAISNYFNLEGSVTDPNNVMVANIDQTSSANVLATATSYQDLTGFSNLADYDGLGEDFNPGTVSHLSATAIGNFASLSFGPSVDLTDPVDDSGDSE